MGKPIIEEKDENFKQPSILSPNHLIFPQKTTRNFRELMERDRENRDLHHTRKNLDILVI